MELAQFIKVAHGNEPADLFLKNARVINVFTDDVVETGIAIIHSRVAGLGDYEAKETIDLGGRYVSPGFIDSHIHIESTLLPPHQFARAVVPLGTTTVVTDPHEIANVLGLEGIRYMLEMSKHNPLSIYMMAPSCVPSSRMETTGASLQWYDLATLLHEEYVLGLGEVMNFPGVINGDDDTLDKLRAFAGRVKDGHCPNVRGRDLMAYVAANIGSDHECTSLDEAMEKLRLGMFIFMREATSSHDLLDLLPLVEKTNGRRVCLCADDRHPADLMDEGHIDHMIRTCIKNGVPPLTAIRMATLNPTEYFHLHDRGAIAPNRRADLVVFSDLDAPRAEMVFRGGKLVAEDGKPLWEQVPRQIRLRSTMNVKLHDLDFRVEAKGRRVRIIGAEEDSLLTSRIVEDMEAKSGEILADTGRDILKLAVVERHMATGNVGLGFIRGLGLKRGAMATTIAHDHHNIVVAGADDKSMMSAVEALVAIGGGMVVADGGHIVAELSLPIAGLMNDRPVEETRVEMDRVIEAARGLGSPLRNPIMTLSFMALPVIPSYKLTDYGLVDVDEFQVVSLFEDE